MRPVRRGHTRLQPEPRGHHGRLGRRGLIGTRRSLRSPVVAAGRLGLRVALAARRRAGRPVAEQRAARVRHAWALESDPEGAVVVVGDSHAARFPGDLLAVLGEPVVHRGLAGATAAQALQEAVGSVPTSARIVLLLAGTNDLVRGARADRVATRVEALASALRARAPSARILVLAVPPVTPWRAAPSAVRRVNRRLEAARWPDGVLFCAADTTLATSHGVPAPGMSADGVHLTRAGYSRVAAEVRRELGRERRR